MLGPIRARRLAASAADNPASPLPSFRSTSRGVVLAAVTMSSPASGARAGALGAGVTTVPPHDLAMVR